MVYRTQGTCSSAIELEIEDGVITLCKIVGGCEGNAEGLARMVVGCRADDVAARLSGIRCQGDTSCPDQLARAIRAYPR